jgi:alpha-mannosidase
VICNPTPWSRREVLTLRIWEGEDPWENTGAPPRVFRLRAADGSSVVAQRLDSGAYWAHGWVDVAVPVEIPAGGWRTYAIDEDDRCATRAVIAAFPTPLAQDQRLVQVDREGTPTLPAVPCTSPLMNDPAGSIRLGNGRLELRFDRRSGGIVRLTIDGRESVPVGDVLGTLALIDERANPMSAWSIGDIRGVQHPLTCDSITAVEEGPHRGAVRCQMRVGSRSSATLTWRVHAGDPRLHLDIAVHWQETGSDAAGIPRLALRLPTGMVDALMRHEVPGGYDTAPAADQVEIATVSWGQIVPRSATSTSATSASAADGVTIATTGISSFRLDRDGTCWLSLLRGSFSPDPLPDQGEHRWQLTLRHGPADALIGHQDGQQALRPLRTTWTTAHGGALPTAATGLTTAPASVAITQLKPADDGRGIIVRLQRLDDGADPAVLRVPAAWASRCTRAQRCDLLERPLADLTITRQADQLAIQIEVPGRGMATVRLS